MWLVFGVILLIFGLTVFRGAPYVPTHRQQVEQALDLLDLKKGDTVVDLGSGDGVFLKAAAKRGLTAYGYEINPILCVIAWLRCWKYRKRVHILWRDFWFSAFPSGTKGVFVFTAGPFISKLEAKCLSESNQQHFKMVSYGFQLQGKDSQKSRNGLHLYRF